MTEDTRQQVIDTERAFARAFAERDFAAFTALISEEAVFMDPRPLHGKQAVAAQWQSFFEAPAAPFSWEPQRVEVLESGQLALSTGPVSTPDGRVVGSFTSVWRQEEPGVWRIVFDIGGPPPV
ncbi:MAG: nuclear transport factor 2 family protein [Akkermansiaceae bacterium]|nr:nuclear transport factor 2 family protein [Verrucomicrobiales bacterium]